MGRGRADVLVPVLYNGVGGVNDRAVHVEELGCGLATVWGVGG